MRHHLLLLAIATTLTACADPLPQADSDKLPDWNEGMQNVVTEPDTDTDTDEDTDVPDNPEPLDSEFNLSVPKSITWGNMLRRWDPVTGETFPTEACDIDLTGVVPGDPKVENCILEFNEGDLNWQGFSLDTHVPAGFCDYLFTQPYVYQTYRIGPGPEFASYTQQADGTTTDEVNTQDGFANCAYDYPNVRPDFSCCYGEYTLTITDAESGEITTEIGIWGGQSQLGSCFDGAAYLDAKAGRTVDGFPMSPTYFVDRYALDIQSVFNPMLTAADALGDPYSTSVGLASYVALADHDGVLPTSLSAIELRPPEAEEDAFPDPDPIAAAFVNPTYNFVCTDNAYDILGVIYLTVREWNTESEFFIDGNWDARELESEVVPLDPFGQFDDLDDWRNFGLGAEVLDKTFIRSAD